MTEEELLRAARERAAANGDTAPDAVARVLARTIIELTKSASAGFMRLPPEKEQTK